MALTEKQIQDFKKTAPIEDHSYIDTLADRRKKDHDHLIKLQDDVKIAKDKISKR